MAVVVPVAGVLLRITYVETKFPVTGSATSPCIFAKWEIQAAQRQLQCSVGACIRSLQNSELHPGHPQAHRRPVYWVFSEVIICYDWSNVGLISTSH